MSDNLRNKGIDNQAKGLGKQVEGKIQNAAGAVTGNTGDQIKGKAKDVAGKIQRKIGESQEDEADREDLG